MTIYVERLYNLAQDAYNISALNTAEGRGIVANQLINNFVEGLADDAMKMKIMSGNTQNFRRVFTMLFSRIRDKGSQFRK